MRMFVAMTGFPPIETHHGGDKCMRPFGFAKHPIFLFKVYKMIHTSITLKTAIVVMKAS